MRWLALRPQAWLVLGALLTARGLAQAPEMIDVGDHKLAIARSGQGGPTVVLESGAGADIKAWTAIMARVGEFTSVMTYARAGRGLSEPAKTPRTLTAVVEELHTLLGRAGYKPPYILVGRSLGGIYVRAFAILYPDETAGLVLAEGSHERQQIEFDKINGITPERRAAANQRPTDDPVTDLEMAGLSDVLASGKLGLPGQLPDRPMAVITALKLGQGQSPEMMAAWRALHDEVFRSTTHGIHIVTNQSDHNVTAEEPDLVVNAIRWVFDTVQADQARTAAAAARAAQEAQLSPLEQRIRRIQNGLLPPVLVKGEPIPREKLTDRMSAMRVPGVSIAVIHGGAVEWARGYGVMMLGGPPVTEGTLFQAASISKPVTALAVLHLVQAGKIGLDADANQYLKSWKIPANDFTGQAPVTVRELLTHTAGLTVHGFPGYAAGQSVPTLKQVLDGAGPAHSPAIRVDTTPGKAWRYSGGGYVVLQQLLGDVTGQDFPALMQATVLGPIGMVHSTYEQPLPANRLAEAATPYGRDRRPIEGGPHTYPEMAPAGLWTTPSDLARYALEVQGSLLGHANHVLSAAMTREMLTPGLGQWGLGVEVGGTADHPYFTHSGSNEGYQCDLVAYENGDGAVVMTNSDNGGQLASQIVAAIAYEYDWPDFRPPERAVVAVDPRSFDALVGQYQLTPVVVCAITREGDQLFTQLTGQRKLRLFPMAEREFFVLPVDATVTFAPEIQGHAPELTIHQNGRNSVAPRIE